MTHKFLNKGLRLIVNNADFIKFVKNYLILYLNTVQKLFSECIKI